MICKCENKPRKITLKKIECNEVGKGIKTICGACNSILRESFLCWNCKKPFLKEEIQKYKKLKGKILTSKMVCSDCNRNI